MSNWHGSAPDERISSPGLGLEEVQQEVLNPLYTMDDDQLLSKMTLADRDKNWEDFRKCREEILYRLCVARPLINIVPVRRRRDGEALYS